MSRPNKSVTVHPTAITIVPVPEELTRFFVSGSKVFPNTAEAPFLQFIFDFGFCFAAQIGKSNANPTFIKSKPRLVTRKFKTVSVSFIKLKSRNVVRNFRVSRIIATTARSHFANIVRNYNRPDYVEHRSCITEINTTAITFIAYSRPFAADIIRYITAIQENIAAHRYTKMIFS